MASSASSTRDTRAVRFVLDGEIVNASDASPTTTVLEYLRERLNRTGTKEGCAEGDCGACTVVLGELAEDGQRVEYRAVNSCIRFLPTIDGAELITVESLQARDGALHPVQQAMVDQHASQCGFCTPGFVMSLFALYLNEPAPRREQVVEALAGNLCRCTGYRPIIGAGCSMTEYPQPSTWSRESAQSTSRIAALKALRREGSLAVEGFRAPRTLDEALAALQAEPTALVLAGGTDIGLWVTKQLRQLGPLVYIGGIAGLKQIRERDSHIEIGAAVPLSTAWQAIVKLYPQLRDLVLRFASPPICNSGTLCGNVANGSPVGDSMPVLIALGAEIELRRGAQIRRLPLERFYLGYQRKDLQPGELVVSVTVPRPRPGERVASYKVSKRFDQDIAAVCAAFAVQVDQGRITRARVAFGGMAAIPARAAATEAALAGHEWSMETIDAAIAALANDFQPLSDMRASDSYRLQVAQNLLRRFYFECTGEVKHRRIDEVA